MKERDEGRGARQAARAIRERLTYANVMATIAALAALAGGGAFAIAAKGPVTGQGEIKACYVKKGKSKGEVRLPLGGKCRRNEGKLVWNQSGKRGPAGAPGAAGSSGPGGAQGDKGNPGDPAWSADCNEGLAAGDVMVRVGSVCIDKYEDSIWTAPSGGTQITGAIPCNANGSDCKGKIFARSVAGVQPRADITWFQAQQALANSGKRLPSNAEWQAAVAGTPDSTACNVFTFSVASTGANSGCVSAWGADDMVGNLWEWVADWVPASAACPGWGSFSDDHMCLSGALTTAPGPGALIRGGFFIDDTGAGPFAVEGDFRPSSSGSYLGFRGAR